MLPLRIFHNFLGKAGGAALFFLEFEHQKTNSQFIQQRSQDAG
jgi:hypothetical protein